MYEDGEHVWYYITAMNENYQHPALPEGEAVLEGIIKGLYALETVEASKKSLKVQLIGCGTILQEVRAAARILKEQFDIESTVWSATSFNELAREGKAAARHNMLHPDASAQVSWVTQQLQDKEGPVIAASDYMSLYANQIREFVPHTFVALGTDGFGRSDTREQLRHFFEVDRHFIVVATLHALAKDGKIKTSQVSGAIKLFGIDPDKTNPLYS